MHTCLCVGVCSVIMYHYACTGAHLVERVDDGLEEVVEEEGDGEGDEDGAEDVEHDAEAERGDGEEADGHQVVVPPAHLPFVLVFFFGGGGGGVD